MSVHANEVGQTADRTDLRNAELLVEWFGRDLRYVGTWSKGLAWDGRRWVLDDEARWQRAAADTVRIMFDDACAELHSAGSDKDKIQAARTKIAWAARSHGAARLAAMVTLARSFPSIVVTHAALDTDPLLLNLSNGTLDLRDLVLREHRREDLITKIAPVDYQPIATAPIWLHFIATILPDTDVREFVQRFAGYCLSADVSERKFVFFHGGGRNGKSVLLRVLRTMLGEYAIVAAPDLLIAKRGETTHPTEIADLAGARLVVCQEVPKGRVLNEQRVKELTGNEGALKARRMNEDFWEFAPTFKLAIGGNHELRVIDDTDAIWDRMDKVPCLVRIPDTEVDKHLYEKIAAQFPGVLRWAVDGYRAWKEKGLGSARAVADATATYRQSQDLVGRFLEDLCVLHPDARITTKDLLQAGKRWAEENDKPLKAGDITDRLRVTKGVREKRTNKARGWAGVRLLTDTELADRDRAEAEKQGDGECSDGVTRRDADSGSLAEVPQEMHSDPETASLDVTRDDDAQSDELFDRLEREALENEGGLQ